MNTARSYKSDFNGNTREQTFSHIAESFGIDGINHPVLLLDGNVRVLAANAKASKLLSRKQSEINGSLLGDVIGCARAQKPDVCGKMFNCTSCAIRQAVTYTLVTDEECWNIPVYPETDLAGQDKKIPFLLSTKKVFDYVFLTIQSKT
jgi:hypothetical protein